MPEFLTVPFFVVGSPRIEVEERRCEPELG
jgi:hypothetical protein